MVEDFHKICRTCLEEITDFKYLFNVQYINEEKLRLSEILTACTSIEVLENDNLPKQVCIKCENNILNAFSFQQLCHKSDSVLKVILSQSIQPQLIELKPLTKIEEESLNSAIQFNDILSYNTSEQDQVQRSEHSSHNLNEKNDSLPRYQIKEETTSKELQTYINENNLSKYHTEFLDSQLSSQDVMLKPSSISSGCTFKKDEINNSNEVVNAQLTSVKILKEDNDDDERNFTDQGYIESAFYSFNENYKNVSLSNYHARAQQIDPNDGRKEVEDETLQPLFPCEAKGCVACFTTLEDLKEHGKKHFPENYNCKICNKIFANAKSLARHMGSTHNTENKAHLCSECGKQFSRSDYLRKHITTHSEKGKKPFECPKCDKRFARRFDLLAHMKTHTGQKDFACNTCKKRFASKPLLTLHIRVHTGEKPFSCNTCGRSFPDRSRLKVHIRSHSGEKPYVCTFCGRQYGTSGPLKIHRRIHTGEKPYQCKFCTESFRSCGDVKRHTIRAHTGKLDHVCDICGKEFIQSGHLKAHMLIHTGERNHVCNICKKGFSQKFILEAHMRNHTGEKPFICNVCNKAYAQRRSWWAHMKSHKRKEDFEAHEVIT